MKKELTVGLVLILAACQKEPAVPEAAKQSGVGAATDLRPYVGKYPFDQVNGTPFLANASVRHAVERSVPEKEVRRWIFERAGPQTPIVRKGDRIVSFGCEAHNCGDHNWSVLVDRSGASAEVCYHDADSMKDRSRWYVPGGAAQMRAQDCPSE